MNAYGTSASRPTVLTATDVSKSFHGRRVLDDFSVTLAEGEVHALLGHNGSGKSTFIKIVAGYYVPDLASGPIEVDGQELDPGNPDSTRDAGIKFVHQTLGLIPSLSVLENLRLGVRWQTRRFARISWRTERNLAREALRAFGLETSPNAIVENLSTVEQTEVAIVRALRDGDRVRILVLDEPTAALTDHEVEKLFRTVGRIKDRGVATIYVTHRLEEIPRIADSVTVLRDGETVGRGPVAEFPRDRLVDLITGGLSRSGAPSPTPTPTPTVGVGQESDRSDPILTVSGLRAGEMLDANLQCRQGEIVGVVGLLGSGAIDLGRALTGRLAVEAGHVSLEGRRVDLSDFATLNSRGVGVVVGRREDRVVMGLSVEENLNLAIVKRFSRSGFLRRRAMRAAADEAIERYEVRCASQNVPVESLSGGNQQKAAIAKALAANPKVLVLEEPCHGVDERGRREIRSVLQQAAAEGALVLVVESDLEEVVGLCSRVVVFRDGNVVAEFSRGGINRAQLLDASYGSND